VGEAVAILGATSSIGRALARRLAARGDRLVLAARDAEELERIAKDLALRFAADVRCLGFDALDFGGHAQAVQALDAAFPGGLDGAFLVWGEQLEQAESEADSGLLRRMVDLNYVSPLLLLERLAVILEARGHGFLCAVTSVAGDRGRASNYHYGSTKAALQAALGGLRVRLGRRGVRVVDARPGFVDTQLTWGRPGVFLAASPDAVAKRILRAVRRDRAVVYAPAWWRPVMLAIRCLPDAIFRRLPL